VDVYERYAEDAVVLGRIGAVLFPQDTTLSVRLPRDLADLALAAWNRDEPAGTGPAGTGPSGAGPSGTGAARRETPDQRAARERAAYLALIGLCIENTAQPAGDDITCDLDAWYIGGALQAAEALNMLPGHLGSGPAAVGTTPLVVTIRCRRVAGGTADATASAPTLPRPAG
jgi:hypothetical protein